MCPSACTKIQFVILFRISVTVGQPYVNPCNVETESSLKLLNRGRKSFYKHSYQKGTGDALGDERGDAAGDEVGAGVD